MGGTPSFFGIPITVILSWPAPSPTDPSVRSPAVWLVSGIFLFTASVCVAVRLYTRLFVRRWFGLDDLFVVLSFLCAIAVNGLTAMGYAHLGLGRHIWDVPRENAAPSLHFFYFNRILWWLSSSFTRLSALCLFYRLLRSTCASKHYYWALHATTGFTVGLLLVYLAIGIVPCWPIAAYWAAVPTVRCVDTGTSSEALAVINTFGEFAVATLPVVAVFKLRVDERQRWTVICLLSLSYVVVLAGCMRTYYIWKCYTTYDLTWWGTPQWMWSEMENDLALICACAAPLRPVLGRFVRRVRARVRRTDTDAENSRHRDAVLEWQAALRVFDLEGIGLDGLGYTVHISGPVEQSQNRVFQRFRRRKVVVQERWDKSIQETKPGLEISRRAEVAVQSSFRYAYGDRSSHGGSLSYTVNSDNLGKSSILDTTKSLQSDMELDRITTAPNPFNFEDRSTENIEALPAMPSPVAGGRSRRLLRYFPLSLRDRFTRVATSSELPKFIGRDFLVLLVFPSPLTLPQYPIYILASSAAPRAAR